MNADLNDLKGIIARVAVGERLNEETATRAFETIISGNATPAQMGAFLMALRVRGETIEELTAAARVMRGRAVTISAPKGAIDVCGTGGDKSGTYNISTCVQFVVAACGVPVAKHGNKAASSKSGAADVLTALGIDINADFSLVKRSLWEAGTCFLMAARHHQAMRNVAGVRSELGTPTIFNLMGPLSNPAGAKRHLVGVFAKRWVEPLAYVLKRLGSSAAWVVHGHSGLDEISITGPSQVTELRDGQIRTFEVSPQDVGLPVSDISEIRGGDAQHNARALLEVLDGRRNAYRDVVLMNAGAALLVAEKVPTYKEGVELATAAIDSGAARDVLDTIVAITNDQPVSITSVARRTSRSGDILARICSDKRKHIAVSKARRPIGDMERAAKAQPPTRGFARSLRRAIDEGGYGLIAEIKKASPSKGIIRRDFDPTSLALAYQDGGASCLSVLTDKPYFHGDDAYLVAARAAVELPALRKDFILDPYQVTEARALGADCILLIMAALGDGQAKELAAAASDYGMDVLVEVHDQGELDRALDLDTSMIGINNRNLKTLEVALATTEALAPQIPGDKLIVAESGLGTQADLARMARVGARCFLVGESLMRQSDVAHATRALLGIGQPAVASA